MVPVLEKKWENQMDHRKPTKKKSNDRNQRAKLQRRHAADRMARGTASRIPCAKPHQKATHDNHHETLKSKQGFPSVKIRD